MGNVEMAVRQWLVIKKTAMATDANNSIIQWGMKRHRGTPNGKNTTKRARMLNTYQIKIFKNYDMTDNILEHIAWWLRARKMIIWWIILKILWDDGL